MAWALVFSGIHFSLKRTPKESVLLGLCVLSHWVLDWVTHRPDMPLAPGMNLKVGLGLWNSLPGALLAEFGLFAAAIYLYLRSTTARDKIGSIGFAAFAVFLVIVWLGALFGPPPPNEKQLAIGSFAIWLLVAWAAWADRHRSTTAS